MSIGTVEKLRNLSVQTAAPGLAPEAEGEGESLGEQLDAIYADVDYLTQKFPRHTIRSLTDYALSLQEKLADKRGIGSAGEANGIIPADVMAAFGTMTQDTADRADLGIVEVDDQGIIKLYNRYESELAGVARNAAVGRNFFLDVAPCTNNRLFFGRFKSGVESGNLDHGFNYTFTYKMKPTPVAIHLFRHAATGRNFVCVKRR